MSKAALKPWPQTPSCYDWLALDARGQWRLQGEVVTHPGLIDFLDAHYAVDEHGRWLVQNGTQQVFVHLHAAPWIVRLHPCGQLLAHDGRELQPHGDFVFDHASRLFVATAAGAAMIDDRDLADFIDEICTPDGQPASEQALLALLDHSSAALGSELSWRTHRVLALPADATGAASHFGFVSRPRPDAPAVPSPP